MKNLSTKQLEFLNELRKLNMDQADALLNFLKLVNGTSSTPANGGDAETEKAFRKTIDEWLKPGSEKKFVG